MVNAFASLRSGRLLPLVCLLLALAGCQTLRPDPLPPPPPPAPPQPIAAVPADQLTAALEAGTVAGTPLIDAKAVRDFYRSRQEGPAWTTPAAAMELLATIRASRDEGLNPQHYHLAKLEELSPPAASGPADEAAVARELLLTDAFLTLASHYRYGRINLQAILPEWQPQARDEKFGVLLEKALAGGEIRASLEQLLPSAPGYVALREAYRHHLAMAEQGGWPTIPAGSKLQQGDHGPRVALLRQRLARSGDLASEAANGDRFDPTLLAAVRRFQSRHGLRSNGVAEAATLKALNLPLGRRIQHLATNLERWRWLPRDLGRRHIAVNIPAFTLTVVENEQPVLTMKVVAGRPDRQTPIFSSIVTHLVLNPTWEVPREIASKDLLPKIKKNPNYLKQFGFRVLSTNGNGGQELDAGRLDWQKITPATFRYHLSQNPGKDNFLGRVKFIFPNPYSVYLHDTPSKKLFLKESRSFSSGCVRLEKPLDLAALLLRPTPLGSREGLDNALTNKATRTLRLPVPTPVHLLYLTTWVEDGTVHFRPDLYGHDRLIEEGLAGRAVRKPLPCLGGCGE